MHHKTILKRVVEYKPFIVERVVWDEEDEGKIRIEMAARRNGKPECSRRCPVHDRLKTRRWDVVPLWQLHVMRRVCCRHCGVVVERVPWSEGKHRQTKEMRWFLATWAKRLSWKKRPNAQWMNNAQWTGRTWN